ncbi:MAG: transposase [Gemmatimonadota bacterium]
MERDRRSGRRGRTGGKADRGAEETAHENLACFRLPPEQRKRLRTTNGVEHDHMQVRRRTRVIRSFPNDESLLRLTSALAPIQENTPVVSSSHETRLMAEPSGHHVVRLCRPSDHRQAGPLP